MTPLQSVCENLLKCLRPAALLAILPALPAAAQALAFVPNLIDADITVIDTSQSPAPVVNTISTEGFVNFPNWVAITPSGALALVTNGGPNSDLFVVIPANSDNIAVINTSQGGKPGGIPVLAISAEKLPQLASCATGGPCRNPGGIAINPVPDASGNIYAYVSNPATSPTDAASVTVINVLAAVSDPTLSNTASATNKCGTGCTAYTLSLPVGSQPRQLSVSPDGTKLWVTDPNGLFYVIDTVQAITSPSTAVVTNDQLGQGLAYFGVAAIDGEHAWVTAPSPVPPLVGLIDLTRGGACYAVGGTFNGLPAGIALLPGSNQAWTAMDSPDAVVVFAPTMIAGPGRESSCPTVVNPGIQIQPAGAAPLAIAFTADGTLAFVTNNGSDTVSRIDTSTPPRVLQSIPTGTSPTGIAIQDSLTFQPGGPLYPVNGVTGGFALTDVNIPLVGSVKWNFGNGAAFNSTALTTSFAYRSPGTYTAQATVLDKSGGTLLTKAIPVQVQSPPQALRTAAVLTQKLLLPFSEQTTLQNDLGAAYNALLAGNRSAALNDLKLYVGQLNSLTVRPPGYVMALNEVTAIGTSLSPPPPLLGRGVLSPQGGSSAVDQPVTFTATWTVPDGKSWRSLQHVGLRLVADNGNGDSDATPLPIALWARFTVGDASGSTPSTFELLDQNENVVGVGEPGSPGVIETNTAKLYLADSSFQGSGPTGPSVTVNFAVSFNAAAVAKAHGAQPYQSQLLASDALQGVQDPVQLGHWVVRPGHS